MSLNGMLRWLPSTKNSIVSFICFVLYRAICTETNVKASQWYEREKEIVIVGCGCFISFSLLIVVCSSMLQSKIYCVNIECAELKAYSNGNGAKNQMQTVKNNCVNVSHVATELKKRLSVGIFRRSHLCALFIFIRPL